MSHAQDYVTQLVIPNAQNRVQQPVRCDVAMRAHQTVVLAVPVALRYAIIVVKQNVKIQRVMPALNLEQRA